MRYKQALFRCVILFVSLSCIGQSKNELNEGIYPIDDLGVNILFEGYLELDSLFTEKEIIAIGESTHGTSEFFTLKTSFFKYLVRQFGYKVFIIEGSFTGTEQINEYVTTGIGDPYKSIIGMGYGIWYTQEMLELVEWIKDYNAQQVAENKIRIYGFDMTWTEPSVDRLIEFMTSKSITDAPILSVLTSIKENRRTPFKSKEQEAINIELYRLKKLIVETKVDSLKYLQYIRLLEQYVTLMSNNKKADASLRDQFMAENIQWIHTNTGEKVFVWAHNAHVMKTPSNTGIMPMGAYLNDALGASYYSVGLLFNKGNFRAVNAETKDYNPISVVDASNDYLEAYLAGQNTPTIFIDLQKQKEVLMQSPIKIRMIGEAYFPTNESRNSQTIVPKEAFDALIYQHEGTASARLDFNKLK